MSERDSPIGAVCGNTVNAIYGAHVVYWIGAARQWLCTILDNVDSALQSVVVGCRTSQLFGHAALAWIGCERVTKMWCQRIVHRERAFFRSNRENCINVLRKAFRYWKPRMPGEILDKASQLAGFVVSQKDATPDYLVDDWRQLPAIISLKTACHRFSPIEQLGRHLSNQLLVFRRKIDEFGVDEGQEMTVHVDIESREYNSRWYIDVKASRVETADAGGPPPTEENPPPPSEAPPSDFDDDIPF